MQRSNSRISEPAANRQRGAVASPVLAGLALMLAVLMAPRLSLAATAPDSSAGEWGYAAEPGRVPPERWGELPDGYSCGRGHHQSPIALFTTGERAARRAPIPPLEFKYRPTALSVNDNGRFISVLCDSAGAVSLAGSDAALTRIDLHAPSEHSLDGQSFPMELEFVHKGTDGPAMIVSVFVKAGQKNAAFDAILKALPKQPGRTSRPAGFPIDPNALLPADHAYLDYLGSFTSPPCTEGVRWCVLRSPIEIAQDQIDRYARDPRLAHSSRPQMPGNGRAVRIGALP
jgi:carbonic anhydrase